MTKTRRWGVALAGCLVAGCVFNLSFAESWKPVPVPGNVLLANFRVGGSELWGALRSDDSSTNYSYIQCIDSLGNERGVAPMKKPYVYRDFTIGPYQTDNGGDVWAFVQYSAPGGSPTSPDFTWIQRLDPNCDHQEFVAVPSSVGDFRGFSTGLAVDDEHRVFLATAVLSGSTYLHYLQRYDRETATWSNPKLMGTASLPGELNPSARLRFDNSTGLLAYGDEWQYSVDPDTLAELGARHLEVPADGFLRDWDIYDDHTVAQVIRQSPQGTILDTGFAIFDPSGELNQYAANSTVDFGALDLGAPKTAVSPPYLPIYYFGNVPGGTGSHRTHQIKLELVSLN